MRGGIARIKHIGLILLAVFCLNFVLISVPQPAYAQAPDVVAKLTAQEVLKKIGDNIKKALVIGTTSTLVNLMTYMANRFAYDAAVWVASGGEGENPLFDPRPPGDYFRYVAGSIANEVVNSIGEDLGPFNLCEFDALFSLRYGLRSAFDRPELSADFCGFDVVNDWDAFVQATNLNTALDLDERNAAILDALATGFDPEKNELSVGMNVMATTIILANSEAESKLSEFIKNSGFQPVADFITGNVETPASLVDHNYRNAVDQQLDQGYNIGQALLSNTDALLQVGVMAGSVFTNTLLSQVMQNIYEGAFEDIVFDEDPFDDIGVAQTSTERAAERLSSLLSFTPLTVTDFNLLSEFTSCPTSVRGSTVGLYNCVMDSSFASAVARAEAGDPLTIQEAIDEGYLSGDWALVPSTNKSLNQDTRCYQSAFCHTNLIKLRKARIISVGWELAAESNANDENDPVTLQEVVSGFNDCNEQDELDDEHPWCHLIDPNWVLKFPESQCRTLAYGQLLEAPGTENRAEECVDVQSCIAEDDEGNCIGGYGYCVREENVWRFRGDSCPSQYASCLTFTGRDGEEADYLQNTLTYDECGSDNAGCLWYATAKEPIVDGETTTYEFPEVRNVQEEESRSDAHTRRTYFTAEVEECDSSGAGCAELVERSDDLSLNLIYNPSFEWDADENNLPDGWQASDFAAMTFDNTNDEGRSGDAALAPASATVFQYGLELSQSQFYTLSLYAKQPNPSASNAISVSLFMTDEDGNDADITGTSVGGDCTIDGTFSNAVTMTVQPADESYQRFECTFTSATLDDATQNVVAILDLFAGNLWIDDVQLEQNELATVFHAGYSEAQDDLAYTYVKVPPAYLGCDGSADDPEECTSYAQVCSAQNVGCNLYTPTNGDPDVSAVVNELNECPSECSGYDTFKQEPTRYDPFGEFPVYFIPSTAEECSAEDVGCDEFTNLDTEAVEYYTYLRACVTETQADNNTSSDGAATFYTWEGSDTEGFQLRTWFLIESNMLASSYAHADSGTIDSDPGSAPCTNWYATEDGVVCTDDSNGDSILDTDSSSCDEHDDIFDNPNCREFYDVNGEIHYRDWSETVTVNNACATYRKTDIAGADATEMEESCTESGGYWEAATNVCLYYGYSAESEACDAEANGCREYTGGRSANSRLALNENFETDLTQWDTADASVVTLSNESIATDGHSLKSEGEEVWTFFYDEGAACGDADGCDSPTGDLGGTCTVVEGAQYCGTLHQDLFEGKVYFVSFWAKGNGSIDVGFDVDASTGSIDIDIPFEENVELSDGWEEFSFGPINASEENDDYDFSDFGEGTTLVFDPVAGAEFFIDNVVLREGEENITVIRESWVTPATCDETADGTYSAQYHLGCQEYTDQNGVQTYLKSFARLCEENQVGCADFFRTQQSESSYGQLFNATCSNVDADGTAGPDVASSLTGCYLFTTGGGTAFETSSEQLCTIAPGETSCSFDLDWILPEAFLTGSLSHIAFGPDTQKIDPDTDVYVVVTDDVTCNTEDAGCMEVGLPTFSADQTVVDSWTSMYLLDDPDAYDTILCVGDDLFCEEYTNENSTYYFKNPLDHTCEYKTDVTIGGQKYDGWFRTGTSNFCYGTGACSEDDTVSCSVDSDCRNFCQTSGTCSLDGSACDVDSDCDDEASIGSCLINDGSYVIGGEISGVWRNGDTDYDGWVGQCTTEWSGCSEFQDTLGFEDDEFYLESDGESYYFIDNDNLDENTLRDSARCNGQVSTTLGCVLFNDTSITTAQYSSSATYIASVHADELFGDQPFSLVDPITCDDGEEESMITLSDGSTIDLCQKRCGYRNSELYDITDPTASGYTYSTSCFDATDCVDYESELGDAVAGSCRTVGVANRLEDDTNRILKVNRDRQCSEWLTCDSWTTVWDEATASYRQVCDSVNLCNEYSATGDAAFCSGWDTEDPAIVLDSLEYASRDVTWYGSEYSGYAIPGLYPIQHLDQVNIAPPPGFCSMSNTDSGFHGDPCVDDTDCGGESGACILEDSETYRLAFNAGECSEDHSEACTVGYCSGSGTPCSSAEGCGLGEGSCITGACYVVDTDTCSVDEDCSGDQICLSGVCAEESGECDLDYSCSDAGATCFPSTATQNGACYRGQCIVSAEGEEFDEALSEPQLCRAHPEVNSPFPNDIVNTWTVSQDTNGDGIADSFDTTEDVAATSVSYTPADVRANFEAVSLCAPGEDCECTYKKLESSQAGIAYIDSETDTDELTQDEFGIAASKLGICSGGTADGTICGWFPGETTDPADAISVCAKGGGTCYPVVKEDTILGLEGYCIEKDTGRQIKGSPDDPACLTWFPVDQLAGSTDLYAKYKQAGYFQDTYVCTEVRPYVTLRISDAQADLSDTNQGIACAEMGHGCNRSDSYTDMQNDCVEGARCPRGFFAVLGQCAPGDWGSSYSMQCIEGGDNDCPYICVPENSVHVDNEFAACLPPKEDSVVLANAGSGSGNSNAVESAYGNDVYYWAASSGEVPDKNDGGIEHLAEFNTVVDAYKDCALTGVDWETINSDGDVLRIDDESRDTDNCDDAINSNDGGQCGCNADASGASAGGYRCLYMNWEVYPGCSEVTKVIDGDGEGYAWTDKVYMGSDTMDSDDANFAYENETDTYPFGSSAISPASAEGNEPPAPMRIGACTSTTYSTSVDEGEGSSGNYLAPPKAGSGFTDCSSETVDGAFGIPVDVTVSEPSPSQFVVGSGSLIPGESEARSVIHYLWTGSTITANGYDWEVTDSFQDVFDRLTSVFAGLDINPDANYVYEWDYDEWDTEGGTLDYDAGEFDDYYGSYDVDVRATEGNAPTVRAIDTSNCYGDKCQEGQNDTITVNDQNSGDQAAEDGFFRITAKFFAFADKNQLPLRRVWLDWGDNTNSGSDDEDNYYKNHRGLQNGSQTTSICDEGEEWGQTPDSCDPNYFSYSHNYFCSQAMVDALLEACEEDEDGNVINSPCTNGLACVFQPRVHVRDNWGWCSGVCTANGTSDNNSSECYDLESDLSSSGINSTNECSYGSYPNSPTSTRDPWVYYDGQIIVTP